MSLARDLALCACLEVLEMEKAPLHVRPVWEALSVACLKLKELSLSHCSLVPRSLPGLVLLLSEGCLTSLSINNLSYFRDEVGPHFDEPGGIAFGDALRANKRLTALVLKDVQLWGVLPAGLAVINGVVGHTTLQKLQIESNTLAVEKRQLVGDVLGRLIAVRGALNDLWLRFCDLADVGLRPLLQALPGNANLRMLILLGDNEICTSEFAGEVLDAVCQNTSLCILCLEDKFPELEAAQTFVSQRLSSRR